MNTLQFKQVDVFTQTSFFGNPVAVVLDGNVAAFLVHTGLIRGIRNRLYRASGYASRPRRVYCGQR
jgi:hypothetical protein